MYRFYTDNMEFKEKPSGKETAFINKRIGEVISDYKKMAEGIGERGIAFTLGSFHSKRTSRDFKEEQIFALDFDSGITFREIKERADYYHIPLLFAYKTFSYTPEHEKFRIVIGFSHVVLDLFTAQAVIIILMKLFPECDQVCKDPVRMFYGGKGLLYLNDHDEQLSPEQLLLSLDEYMRNQYGHKHYTEHLKKFYQTYGIATDKKGRVPITEVKEEDDRNIFVMKSEAVHSQHQAVSGSHDETIHKRRSVMKDFDWHALYEHCELFRKFQNGEEYYYYPQLFHLALNLCCVDGGRKKFMEILNSDKNSQYEAYSERDWASTLNDIIKHEYLPKRCSFCPFADSCHHGTNMISTIKPSRHDVKLIEPKEYCMIEEAEESLADHFKTALNDRISNKIKLIIAQTGLGKTRLYLDMLVSASEMFMIVVPTHDLKDEIHTRALNMGVKSIMAMPRLPVLSEEIQAVINHYYDIGAGELAIQEYRRLLETLDKHSEDYREIKQYLDKVDEILKFPGHIILTHERFLYLSQNSDTMRRHRIIIDEDIMQSVFAVESVNNHDIHKAMKKQSICSNPRLYGRLKHITEHNGMIRFSDSTEGYLDRELVNQLNDVNSNVLELQSAKEIITDKNITCYLKVRQLPYKEMIILSATANPELYRMMMSHREIEVYQCKEVRYEGRIIQYTDQTYSRACFNKVEDLIKKLKKSVDGCEVITFRDIEEQFGTRYHFGGVEGLDILKGKNLCVIGMPNVSDIVYKLYGMRAGAKKIEEKMKTLRIQHNGYDFSLHTYEDRIMQTVQIWCIESLLEQAVGRVRLLRCNCDVRVYSGFPVAQAEFVKR